MDDLKDSLTQIIKRERESLISLLLEIQKRKVERVDFLLNFLNKLECFHFGRCDNGGPILLRRWINALENGDYVALSYTWNPSDDEGNTSGRYYVENRSKKVAFPSPVRDSIFQRIAKYMRHEKVDLLWIDRHSIPQKPQEGHASYRQKTAGIQSMGWVYRLSDHPVALLGRSLSTKHEMCLLHGVLTGKYTRLIEQETSFELSVNSHSEASQALKLLYDITNDLWWQRAWTFQENYKGGEAMKLLISHLRSWEPLKRQYVVFGDIPGELCIESSNFSRQITRFCLAFRRNGLSTSKRRRINSILSRAGRYTILLDETQTLTAAIVADVLARDVKEPCDRLPIIANCCEYPVRLDTQKLLQNKHSLSLSILTTCLLNGEILRNGPLEEYSSDTTISGFLKRHLLSRSCPTQIGRTLAFNQGSRFNTVKLTEAGITTMGHLWEVDSAIQTAGLGPEAPSRTHNRGDIGLHEYRCLTQLCDELQARSENVIAKELRRYLQMDSKGKRPFQIGEDYMILMAAEVAAAIGDGKAIRLGRIWDPKGHSYPCTALFVWDEDDLKPQQHESAFVFTSLQPKFEF
ncbi:hypothetical protein TruAng_006448 [Truncatella angustata]|nr:hypothetical protein TruAng_006448 [Truncatella angustata]